MACKSDLWGKAAQTMAAKNQIEGVSQGGRSHKPDRDRQIHPFMTLAEIPKQVLYLSLKWVTKQIKLTAKLNHHNSALTMPTGK